MDPHGPIARRFPLVARFRPACLPLPDRVRALVDLADRAAEQLDQGLASTIFNQAALLASDIGLPDLARSMCHRHAQAYLTAGPLPAMSAIRGLEPLINLARLQIRAGHPDDARQRLLDLYEAVGAGTPATFEGITVPADLTRTDEDRHEVHAWLWRVLLADGTRTLTTTGRWQEALTHIERHRGVGTRMLDGRQVAVVAALTEGNTDRSAELLNTTAPGEPWEQAVTACLTTLCHRDAGQDIDNHLSDLASMYLTHEAKPALTVFDIRLGLTALDAVASIEHPAARRLVEDIARRTADARDGYAAREFVTHPQAASLATARQTQDCRELIEASALGAAALPGSLHASLSAALDTAGEVLTRAVSPARRTIWPSG
ncbi:hypothetical protein OG552_09230 [Streptomyces sp. NBC_01476]|uniref:hypothetical protein n=1 Tax=Streptomyces sp. NBC_01476 TaxID=2903881 RepID=UPI002E382364|nr:hypothetical protein [Streptomyces sp. NBC_01476]